MALHDISQPIGKLQKESVKKLEALKPNLVITGHGPFMEGEELHEGLLELAMNLTI